MLILKELTAQGACEGKRWIFFPLRFVRHCTLGKVGIEPPPNSRINGKKKKHYLKYHKNETKIMTK